MTEDFNLTSRGNISNFTKNEKKGKKNVYEVGVFITSHLVCIKFWCRSFKLKIYVRPCFEAKVNLAGLASLN